MMHNNTTTCKLWPNHPHRCDVLVAVQKVCPSLSIIGCVFVMVVIWLFKKYLVFVQRLIFALTFSAMCQSISYLLGNVYSNSSHLECHIQGFMMQYFLWSTLSWVIVITINMLLIIKGMDGQKFEYHYHLFVWLNALFWACLPFIKDTYGHAGIWCWIKKDASTLRFGVWYLPLLLVCIFMLSVYVYIFIHNKRLSRSANGTELELVYLAYKREVQPLFVYPLIYLILTIPIFAYRLYDAIHPDKEPLFGLLLSAVLFAPSVGSCTALGYAFYTETIRKISLQKMKQAFNSRVKGEHAEVRPYEVESARSSMNSRRRTATVESLANLEFLNDGYGKKEEI